MEGFLKKRQVLNSMGKKAITEDELRHVAEIARIKLTPEEVKLFTKQASDIVSWFKELSEVNTKGVKPSYHPLETKSVIRKDEVKPSLSHEEALSNTSHKEKGYFKAPRVV